MESTHQIILSPQQKQILLEHSALLQHLIGKLIGENAGQLGYMLQAYHPREKISGVRLVDDSVTLTGDRSAIVVLQYLREEYNACRAIDYEEWDKMKVSIEVDHDCNVFRLTGENWPEL